MRSGQYALMAFGAFVWVIAVFFGRGKHFGREDYGYSNPVGDGRNVHNTYHIYACVDVGKSQATPEGNLNIYRQLTVIVYRRT